MAVAAACQIHGFRSVEPRRSPTHHMPLPCHFQRAVELEAPVGEVFAFHGDPHNIKKISPRWQKVEVESGEASPQPGADFRIVVRFFGLLPMRWHGVWREVRVPEVLVDEA